MLANTLIAILVVFLMLAGWIAVQHAARLFAARHPEFGPAREEGEGCGSGCRKSEMADCPLHQAGLCQLAVESPPPAPNHQSTNH